MDNDTKKAVGVSGAFGLIGIMLLGKGLIGAFSKDPTNTWGSMTVKAQPGIAVSQCLDMAAVGALLVGVAAYLIYSNLSD